jgi:CRP/FNR family transcriptional regulator
MSFVLEQRQPGLPGPVAGVAAVRTTAAAIAPSAECQLWQLCARTTGASADPGGGGQDVVVSLRRLAPGEALYRTGDALRFIYAVGSGSLKSTVTLADGREQICGFFFAGDFMALDAVASSRHGCAAYALEETLVHAFSYASLLEAMHGRVALQRSLRRRMGLEIVRAQRVLLLLGCLDAQERLASFLLDLSRRLPRDGLPACEFTLQMTRAEIASYLGLSLETVSRTFSLMRRCGLLDVEHRRVRIVDRDAFVGRFAAVLGRD